jgi:hypothetical protein
MLTITNMLAVQCSEVMSEKFNIETGLVEIMHRNGSLNCITINLQFLQASMYRLKHIKETRQHQLLPISSYL